MLQVLSMTDQNDQRKILSQFDPTEATWVVSDLKSKLDINRSLLRERPFLPADTVLRASELWRKILLRVRPDLQVVSREFIMMLIAEKLAALPIDWVKVPGAATTAYDYLSQLMPILSHPEGEEMLEEWFSKNETCQVRWGQWYQLARTLWKEFLEEGYVAPSWLSGVLINEPKLSEVWIRSLVIDLGAELSKVEADLLVHMSKFLDVTVVAPEPSWRKEYERALSAYQIFAKELSVKKIQLAKELEASTEEGRASRPVDYRKYTTMIAEIKDTTAQVRQWLEQGVRPDAIAVVAPDIEVYWSALSVYLDQEGIPCQKGRVQKLHAFPDIARWLSQLRLKLGQFSEADVELSLFDSSGHAERMVSFERFKVLYSMIYSREDLKREVKVSTFIESEERAPQDRLKRDEFVEWSLRLLPSDVEISRVETLFKRLFGECPPGLVLSMKRWLEYFEQLTAKIECVVEPGQAGGISCINLSSADNSPATHMMILGLTESALRQMGGTAILFADVESLSRDLGFHLMTEDSDRLEFEARWVVESSGRTLVLGVPETDFSGGIQTASWLWVRGAKKLGQHDRIATPMMTRWDELQRSGLPTISHERNWSSTQREYLEHRMNEDLGNAEINPFAQDLVTRLSPSGIEDYLNCPFIFAAKRLFGLSDVAELDLEVDPSRQGSLMHKLFEILTAEPMRFEYSDEELTAVVDQARLQSALELADERLWSRLKVRYVELAKRFLAYERECRAMFPETKTIGRELNVTGYVRMDTGEFTAKKSSNALSFVGRIDRVDQDAHGHVMIMDYKSSMASASQYGSWLEKNKIQLLLYAMAVEAGLTPLSHRTVVAALYYIARTMNRDYGFKVEDTEQGLYEVGDKRKKNRLTQAEKQKLFVQGQELIQGVIQRILSGQFSPQPREPKNCDQCKWSVVCRAPHLNS